LHYPVHIFTGNPYIVLYMFLQKEWVVYLNTFVINTDQK
jgi:hypothetical protein